MKPLAVIGVLLLLAGGAALAVGRFSYTTERPVVAVGPITASVTERHSIALPDIAGFGLLVLGGGLLLLGRRRT